MLLDIQSIPDLRPCQTPAPDIDSIRCPDFGSSGAKMGRPLGRSDPFRGEIPPPKQYGGISSPAHNLNGYDTFFATADEVPYHARTDSKPFTYGAVTSSPLLSRHRTPSDGGGGDGGQPPQSPSIHRKNSREALGTTRMGLESPRLVRRMSGSVGASPGDGYRHSRSPSPDPGSRGGTMKRERAHTMTARIMASDASPTDTLGRSTLTRSASRLDDVVDGSFSHDSFNRSYSSGGSATSSWLQTQQRKLQERREAKYRAEKGPQEAKMLSELRSRILQSGEESTWQSDTDTLGTNRPITPAFPPSTPTTPYLNQGLPPKSPTAARKEVGGIRSPSPATNYFRQELNGHSSPAPSLYHGQSRRSSLTSLNDSIEVISSHPKFVKDISKFWYKPNISRDDAINMLRDKSPGTFVVRDSNSFPGAFGLALKVSTPPPNVTSKSADPSSELVRHFLIEPTSRGVRLKGCANEPVFGSLSALVYQHSITALALPCRLVLPDRDPAGSHDTTDSSASTSKTETSQLLQQGAACNVLYLYSADTESLTGPQAVKRAIQMMLAGKPTPTVVHFKVSSQGITLTDNARQLFFRRHYAVNTISHCGLDPDDRRWAQKNEEGEPIGSLRMFGFVAKKGSSRTENQCHVIAELDPDQPATAICNFVTKVMMTSVNRSNLV